MGGGLTKCGVQSSAASFAVYHHLEHLGLPSTRQPLETSLNAVTFWHSSCLWRGKKDGPGWEPGRPTGGPFVWEIAESVSANSAHPAVIFQWEAGRRGGGFRGAPAAVPLLGQGNWQWGRRGSQVTGQRGGV